VKAGQDDYFDPWHSAIKAGTTHVLMLCIWHGLGPFVLSVFRLVICNLYPLSVLLPKSIEIFYWVFLLVHCNILYSSSEEAARQDNA
jgi:hypothetical protein